MTPKAYVSNVIVSAFCPECGLEVNLDTAEGEGRMGRKISFEVLKPLNKLTLQGRWACVHRPGQYRDPHRFVSTEIKVRPKP